MNLAKLRFNLLAALAAALLIAVPSQAQKRRAVGQRSPGAPFSVDVLSGTVLDSVTNQPVVGASVFGGNRTDVTDAQGRFDLKVISGFGSLTIQIERSGYEPFTSSWKPGDPTPLSLRLKATKTVTIRKTSGENVEVDMESLKFGYPVPFSGYRDAESEDFCTVDGNKVYIHRAQMAKLTGPAVLVAGGACCTSGNAEKMTLTLKSGQTMDVLFTDTCEERYKVDIGARLHTTGTFVHVPITDIAEIVFP
jgi:hypothetical protein